MAEQRTLVIDPGNERTGGIIVQTFGDRMKVLSEMRDNGDGTVSWIEVHAPRPPIIDQIARVRAEG